MKPTEDLSHTEKSCLKGRKPQIMVSLTRHNKVRLLSLLSAKIFIQKALQLLLHQINSLRDYIFFKLAKDLT